MDVYQYNVLTVTFFFIKRRHEEARMQDELRRQEEIRLQEDLLRRQHEELMRRRQQEVSLTTFHWGILVKLS